ncbi:VanW family protein [Pseudactinotalea sp. Z1732]|uniref:VanW family protein n=1 Tax=Pseudactinotalea sp. Z1732 TaxID=3413026 RepID=UPI003C7D25AF
MAKQNEGPAGPTHEHADGDADPRPSEGALDDGSTQELPGPDEAPAADVRRTPIKDRRTPEDDVTPDEPAGTGDHARADDVTPDEPADTGDHAPEDDRTPDEPADAEEPARDDDATGVVDPPTTDASDATDDPDATMVAGPPGAVSDDQDSPLTAKKKTTRKKRGLTKVGIWVGVIVLLLAAAYVGSAYFLGDRVPADTTVAGVDVSGLPTGTAEQVLTEELGGLETEPLPLTFADSGAEIEPASAGLSFDAAATVDQFTGFTLNPRILLGHLFGLGEQEPVSHVDEAALEAALEGLAEDLDISPVEGSISIVDAEAEITDPQEGAAVDVPEATELLAAEWITGSRPLELPELVVQPEIGPEEIRAAMDEVVEPFLSGPVTVAVNDAEVELSTEELADAATLEVNGTRFDLALDGQELAETVTAKEDSIGEVPRDARIELQGGEPTVIPAVTGTGLDPEELAPAVRDASLQTEADQRVATVELSRTEAEFTTADAEALGVVEVIGRYSTPMPYDPPRTENLVIGTSRINGTLLMPGEEFSLLDALSPITEAGGYNSSGVVVDGFATEAAGGGLSQLSTTVFNAAFEAGLEDITHQPHSRWFSRYPEGREATLFSPDLDMRFGNNTDYGVLIHAWVGDGQTHVVLWGTDVWDVDIVTGSRYNITSPQTVYNQDPRCEPESGGQSGFTVQVTRTVSAGGEVHEQRTYTHTYRPWNRVVCGEPPSASDDDDDDDENGDDD